MATSTLMPTAVSIAAMVSPVRASARLSTKCQRCSRLADRAGAPRSPSRVLRMLGTSVAEISTQVGRRTRARRCVYSSRPDAVSITTYLNDSMSRVEHPFDLLDGRRRRPRSVSSGAQRTNRSRRWTVEVGLECGGVELVERPDRVGERAFRTHAERAGDVTELQVEVDDHHFTRRELGEPEGEVASTSWSSRRRPSGTVAMMTRPRSSSTVSPVAVEHAASRGSAASRRLLERSPQVGVVDVGSDHVAGAGVQRGLQEVGRRLGHDHHADVGSVVVERGGEGERHAPRACPARWRRLRRRGARAPRSSGTPARPAVPRASTAADRRSGP